MTTTRPHFLISYRQYPSAPSPQQQPFCTIPSKCSVTSPPSILSHPQAFHPITNVVFFPHIGSSSFQVTQQHPLLPSKSKPSPPCHSQFSSHQCSVYGRSISTYFKNQEKRCFFRQSKDKNFSLLTERLEIRKIKCFNTKRNGKRPLTSSVLVKSQL